MNTVSIIADVFAAIGTVAAVIVALYLARRDENVRIRVTAGIYEQFSRDPVSYEGSLFGIFATNIGRRPASLADAIDLKIGLWKPRTFLIIFPPGPYNTPLNEPIQDGRQATFVMPKEQFMREIRKIGPDVRSRIDRKWIRIGVHARNGGSYYTRLKGPTLDEIMTLINEADTTEGKDSA